MLPTRILALSIAAVLTVASPAAAELVSESSDFGENTITFDTETGLRWLDLTESILLTYAGLLDELEPGGDFEGYRLATLEEVLTLWENAGIDVSTEDFVPQNYTPIVTLAGLVGQLRDNGNCGTGCTFFFSQGWLDGGIRLLRSSRSRRSPGSTTPRR